MRKYFLIYITGLLFLISNYKAAAQKHISTDTLTLKEEQKKLLNIPFATDSNASSFIIIIKEEVKLHKHLTHSEHVYILEGEGVMILGTEKFTVKKGDLIYIPENTPHALKVTSAIPVKVLSIQAPYFDGKDRVFIENK